MLLIVSPKIFVQLHKIKQSAKIPQNNHGSKISSAPNLNLSLKSVQAPKWLKIGSSLKIGPRYKPVSLPWAETTSEVMGTNDQVY